MELMPVNSVVNTAYAQIGLDSSDLFYSATDRALGVDGTETSTRVGEFFTPVPGGLGITACRVGARGLPLALRAIESAAAQRAVRNELGGIKLPGKGPLSPDQMNKAIAKGDAPAGIKRVDTGKVVGEQSHVHFGNGSALNKDGTWKHGGFALTNKQIKWLRENGWELPR